jgi:hypothetical protein
MRRTHRALAMLALSLALVTATAAVAAAAPSTPPAIEDQHDRLLRNLQTGQAERVQAAVELARSMERNLTPVPAAGVIAAQPVARITPAAPDARVDVLATLLLGLVGGLVGGGAAMAGWAAATRRRLHRAAPAI